MATIFQDNHCILQEDVQISEGNWKLEKKLWVLVFIFTLANASMVTILCWYKFHSDDYKAKGYSGTSPLPTSEAILSPPDSGKDICSTPDCVVAASSLINSMKHEVSPCVDFYEYACGGFIESNYIPDDKESFDQFTIVQEEIAQQIKEDSELLRKMKDFYGSCMNQKKIKEIGFKPLKKLIETFGGWPVVMGDQWNDNGFQWQELMFRFKDADVSPDSFLSLGVTEDSNDTKHILTMSYPEYLMTSSVLEAKKSEYLDNLVQAAVLCGADMRRAKEEMTDVLQMEIELSELLPRNEEESNKVMDTDLFTLQKLAPGLNWKSYLERILPIELEDNERIKVLSENYTLHFTKILTKKSPRTLANFAVWMVIRDMLPLVSNDFGECFLPKFNVNLESKRWRRCLKETREIFPTAIFHEYIDKWFSIEKKSKVNAMVKHIKEEMMDMLRNAKWLDSTTLQKAEQKLLAMDAVVAYPEEILDYNTVAQIYENFTVHDGAYFQNTINKKKFQRDNEFSKLHQPVIKHDWKKYSKIVDVNAHYYFSDNSLVVPAFILQGVFFNYERPEYMNFASIGAIIGHEIIHRFDDKGRQYNKDSLREHWWQKKANQTFMELAKCLKFQHNNYTSPEVNLKMNGENCLDENIADNGGLKNAYHAYQKWVQKHGKEPRLPGLNLTTNQLFWMSYANIWCSKAHSEYIKYQIEYEDHTIARFRVNGQLWNMPEFARDFNCPLYSNMNPKEKCAVW